MTDSSSPVFTEAWLRGPLEIEFYTRTYVPTIATKAVLIFIHGFIEHIGRYEHVFPTYSQAGIAVFAFDQRGFGRTALDPGPDGQRQKARESRNEGYGRTWSEQQKEDIFWAIKHAGDSLAGWGTDQVLPVFLMGHSMGGGLVLSFGALPPSFLPVPLTGIIATSPFLAQRHPANKIVRKVGGVVGLLSPWSHVPAGINPNDLSHDKTVGEKYLKDPLVKQYGTLKGVSTMLNLADYMSSQGYASWPVDLPVLFCQGTDDQVVSPEATEKFYNHIKVEDKTLTFYERGFHELHNEPEFKQRLLDEVTAWVIKHTDTKSAGNVPGPDAKL